MNDVDAQDLNELHSLHEESKRITGMIMDEETKLVEAKKQVIDLGKRVAHLKIMKRDAEEDVRIKKKDIDNRPK